MGETLAKKNGKEIAKYLKKLIIAIIQQKKMFDCNQKLFSFHYKNDRNHDFLKFYQYLIRKIGKECVCVYKNRKWSLNSLFFFCQFNFTPTVVFIYFNIVIMIIMINYVCVCLCMFHKLDATSSK